MFASMSEASPTPALPALRRGWGGRCPRCGEGALFGRYLKMRDHCPVCSQPFEPYRADDAPAYFTILVVGHVIVPLVLAFEKYAQEPPLWLHAALWLPLSIGLSLLLLPRIKGAVIAVLWAHRAGAEHPATPHPATPGPAPAPRPPSR
jgi:uncharacterized protein (DUF983 family)